MFIAIVPAYNEEKRIASVVKSLRAHVDEVVVVDDCSTDDTARIAGKLGATVLSHGVNLGQGASLETGHEYARKKQADYVLHFDGDEQFDVADIVPALEKLQTTHKDILFGSRFLDNRSNMPFFKRHILLPVGRMVNILFASIPLRDAQNGFRILNAHALDMIHISQNRMAHATEIMSLVKKYDLTYIEFPVKVYYHEYGQAMSGGFRIMRDLVVGKFVK